MTHKTKIKSSTKNKKHSRKHSRKNHNQQIAVQKIQLLENGHKTRLLVMQNRNDTHTAS